MPRQLPFELPHRASLDRDDLIVTPANGLAVAAVDSWPDWPHPVLLVVGPPGSGKSHLASAWGAMAGAEAYAGALPEERPFAVVLDDVDSERFAEASLFELLNAARLGGGFVLATARHRPREMGLGLPDLVSRLSAATLAEIGAPDDALLTGVLAKLFADRQLAVDPRLLDFAATRMERSLDAARRIVAAVDREALAAKGRITRGLVQRVIEEEGSSRDEAC